MDIKIGSFNIEKWGYASDKESRKDFQKIAEIIIEEKFDVVALQEIFSEGKGVQRMLATAVKSELYNWSACFGFPKDAVPRGEGYAFLWNNRSFKLTEFIDDDGLIREFQPRIINSELGGNDVQADCSIFARTPYYIRLQPVCGGFFELRLITIHIHFGSNYSPDILKRKLEYTVLTQEIYPSIALHPYGNHRIPYTIAMGDYNLNLLNPLVSPSNPEASVAEVQNEILTVQEKLTSIDKNTGGLANNYDHFTYSSRFSQFQSVAYDRVEAIDKYCGGDSFYYKDHISDHLPISMTITI